MNPRPDIVASKEPGSDEDYPVDAGQISSYRRDGFIQLRDVITGEKLRLLRDAVTNAVAAESAANEIGRNIERAKQRTKSNYEQIFIQKVNLWTRHATVRPFALSRRFANIAARLSGHRVRLWHDQALFKEPRTGSRTPWHQDGWYWPHAEKDDQITIWIALRDATIRNGCMSFLPGSQTIRTVEPINLGNPQDVFQLAPQLKKVKPATCELKAGSVTFHNGMTFHYAGPNRTDEMREAFAVIYMPDGTTYNGEKHIVMDPLKLAAGGKLEGELFPVVSD